MLEHFNHGLALAQRVVVIEELYEDKSWPYDAVWPGLEGDADCGVAVGCLCGTEKEEVQQASDEETSSEFSETEETEDDEI